MLTMNTRHRATQLVLLRVAVSLIGALGFLGVPAIAQAGPRSEVSVPPSGIESLEAVELGGVRQWILIRGEDRTKPVLLWLHGGPGSPTMPMAHRYDRELLEHFVVVHWDQRGAGKSFDPALRPEDLTPERYIEDTHQLIQHLQGRLGAERVYLVGHSWGTLVGVEVVRRYPELVRAYVGMGQVLGIESFRMGYAELMEQAHAAGDADALRDLEALGPPPWSTYEQLATFGSYNTRFGWTARRSMPDEEEILASSPYYTASDLENAAAVDEATLS
jgi:pimeloyl-ACP methyl ester carboxylesterase